MQFNKHYSKLRDFGHTFGFRPQCNKLVEETGEMLAELSRVVGHEDCVAVRLRLVEELADMWIVAAQLLILMDEQYPHLASSSTYEKRFWDYVDEKMIRTEARIKTGYYGSEDER